MSLLSIDDGVFEVLATAGDTHLGGEDFDNRVIEYFTKLYTKKTGTDVSTNLRAMGKLKREAKRTLSNQQSTRLEIESFEGGNDFSETLIRAKFEELNMDLFRKTMTPAERVLKDANVKEEDNDEVVLIGGSTRIPKVQRCSRITLAAKSPPRESTPMRPSPSVLLSRVAFSPAPKALTAFSLLMSARSPSVSRPPAVSSPSSFPATLSSPPGRAKCVFYFFSLSCFLWLTCGCAAP